MDGVNCGFELQPDTLARIAALGVKVGFDLYAPDDAQSEVVVIPDRASGHD